MLSVKTSWSKITAMPTIHPSAVIDDSVTLADDVTVGPGCVLTGDVTVGAGTTLIGQVWLNGPLTLGERNVCYPGCRLGFAPQSIAYNPNEPGHGVVIGDENTFREGVTIHRAMTDDGPTRVGSNNFLMVNTHLGHDTIMGDRNVLANGALVAGHVTIGDRVVMGGNCTLHQFIRVGDGAMISGLVGTGKDIPPWFTLTAINVIGSLNLIGMRRNGFTRDEIDDARWSFRQIYRQGVPPQRAVELLRERADRPVVQRYIEFIETSARGITPGHGRARRATVAASNEDDA